MGYPRNLVFDRNFHEDLICKICKEVILDPTYWIHCFTLFCANCVADKEQCANCEKSTTFEKEMGLISKMLNGLNVKWIYSENGCTQFLKLRVAMSHAETWKYKPAPCFYCEKVVKGDEPHKCKLRLKKKVQSQKLEIEKIRKEYGRSLSKNIKYKERI